MTTLRPHYNSFTRMSLRQVNRHSESDTRGHQALHPTLSLLLNVLGHKVRKTYATSVTRDDEGKYCCLFVKEVFWSLPAFLVCAVVSDYRVPLIDTSPLGDPETARVMQRFLNPHGRSVVDSSRLGAQHGQDYVAFLIPPHSGDPRWEGVNVISWIPLHSRGAEMGRGFTAFSTLGLPLMSNSIQYLG